MIFVLLVLLCVVTNAMDRMDYERSAREKRERYEAFVKIMTMLENSEECISDLADRREFPQIHINPCRMVDEDDPDDSSKYVVIYQEEVESPDYIILRREDFE